MKFIIKKVYSNKSKQNYHTLGPIQTEIVYRNTVYQYINSSLTITKFMLMSSFG